MAIITDNSRPDLSHYLIHFTKGDSEDEAFEKLENIIKTKTIEQSYYKCGGENITCFTETPIQSIKSAGAFVNWTNYTKYSRFGILFHKKDLYSKGSRPVFNCKQEYHKDFPEHLQWRCKKFEPTFEDKPSDFAWEREWRMKGNLSFDDLVYEVIVPDFTWGTKLIEKAKIEDYNILNHGSNTDIINTCYDDCLETFCDVCEECDHPDPAPCLICIQN